MGIGLGLQGVAIGCDLNVEVNGCGILVIVIGCGYRLYSGKRRTAPALPCTTAAAAAAASADTGLRIFLHESGEGRGIPLK